MRPVQESSHHLRVGEVSLGDIACCCIWILMLRVMVRTSDRGDICGSMNSQASLEAFLGKCKRLHCCEAWACSGPLAAATRYSLTRLESCTVRVACGGLVHRRLHSFQGIVSKREDFAPCKHLEELFGQETMYSNIDLVTSPGG